MQPSLTWSTLLVKSRSYGLGGPVRGIAQMNSNVGLAHRRGSVMVNLVKHDLEFILKQIKIAERHAAGEDLRDLVAEAGGLDSNAPTAPSQAHLLPYGLRTVDGTYNNL